MSAPDRITERLAAPRIFKEFREQVTVRSAPITARLATTDRLRAFQQLVRGAKHKPGWLYDAQREEQRRSLPDERQHAAICEGIAGGYITERDIATFLASQYLVYRGLFHPAADTTAPTFCDAANEMAEALDALAKHRAFNTHETKVNAMQQGTEAALTVAAHVMSLAR